MNLDDSDSDDGDLDDVDLLRVDAVHFPWRSSVLQGLAWCCYTYRAKRSTYLESNIPQAPALNPKHEKNFYKLCWMRKLGVSWEFKFP